LPLMEARKSGSLLFVAGPCLVESWDVCAQVAEAASELAGRHGLDYIFKGSYRKANRTSGTSMRGIGDERALEILARIKREFGVAVTTDVHETSEVAPAAAVCDLLQIPAFLCRQTELVEAAAATGLPVNIKKGPFMAPEDMGPVAEKARAAGAGKIYLTERGSTFGYHDLVVDFRALDVMRGLGCPVIFDATHSVQKPGALSGVSGGDRRYVPLLLRAALAAGIDGVFLETHPDPERAASDRKTQWPLADLPALLADLAGRGLLQPPGESPTP
jgi:2-dehydro-3-deoxyphosphooctonate aldolase (KDO 8-P synthase)